MPLDNTSRDPTGVYGSTVWTKWYRPTEPWVLADCTTPSFEFDLHFGHNSQPHTCQVHVYISDDCNAIVLTRFWWLSGTNKHTNTCQTTLQDMSLVFGLLTHTQAPADTLKTTPAFVIATGNKRRLHLL